MLRRTSFKYVRGRCTIWMWKPESSQPERNEDSLKCGATENCIGDENSWVEKVLNEEIIKSMETGATRRGKMVGHVLRHSKYIK